MNDHGCGHVSPVCMHVTLTTPEEQIFACSVWKCYDHGYT